MWIESLMIYFFFISLAFQLDSIVVNQAIQRTISSEESKIRRLDENNNNYSYDCKENSSKCYNWIFNLKLSCEGEQLQCIPQWNKKLKHGTKELTYKNNEIKFLPSKVFQIQFNNQIGLRKIIILDLSHNQISEIELNAFNGLTALETLNLASNKLITIPTQVFKELQTLTTLTLNGNNLVQIPSNSFIGLKSLEKLELNDCKLNAISPNAFEDLQSLKLLDLTKNSIQNLLKKSLANLPDLQTLKLKENKDLRLKSINWMQAFGYLEEEEGIAGLVSKYSSEDLAEYDEDEFITIKRQDQVPCHCEIIDNSNTKEESTGNCLKTWKFFKSNTSLECIGDLNKSLKASKFRTALVTVDDENDWTYLIRINIRNLLESIGKIFIIIIANTMLILGLFY